MSDVKKIVLGFALCTLSVASWAQNAVIHGVVTDEHNEPVIGASIQAEGTKVGAVTDIDGNFSIGVSKGATLSISYIGYNTMQVKASDGMKIQLKEAANDLNEVVVTGYGGHQKRAP